MEAAHTPATLRAAARLATTELLASGTTAVLTMETVHDRTYPLYDEIYMYVDQAKDKSIDPKVKEFLRFILSREGQAAVMRDGKYLPLTAEVVREQLRKLE